MPLFSSSHASSTFRMRSAAHLMVRHRVEIWLLGNQIVLYPFVIMTTDSEPATKADIAELKGDIGKLMEALSNLYRADEKSKDEILTSNEGWKKEIIRHFDVAFETHSQDIFGAFGDRYVSLRDVQRQHGQRLNRLEAQVGHNN